jgi:hypothetical protein
VSTLVHPVEENLWERRGLGVVVVSSVMHPQKKACNPRGLDQRFFLFARTDCSKVLALRLRQLVDVVSP